MVPATGRSLLPAGEHGFTGLKVDAVCANALLNGLHEADRTIRGAIQEAIAQGAHVVPATGRSLLPAGEHGFTGLKGDAVCANGSIIRGRTGELLKTFTVDPAFVEELIRSFPQICFDCCTPDGMFSSGSCEMHQEGFARDNLFRRIVMRGMRARGGTHEEQFFDQSISSILSHDVCKINCRVTSDGLERAAVRCTKRGSPATTCSVAS